MKDRPASSDRKPNQSRLTNCGGGFFGVTLRRRRKGSFAYFCVACSQCPFLAQLRTSPLSQSRPTRPLSLPLVEPIYRQDAPPFTIGFPEGRQGRYGFALGVDRLAATAWVLEPARDQTPTQWIKRDLAGGVIEADHKQLLARRSVPARRVVVDTALPRVHPLDDGVV